MKKSLANICLLCISLLVNSAIADTKILDKILVEDMLGSDVTYLESLIGPAKRTDTSFHTKEYVIEGCYLNMQYTDNRITTLTLSITPNCSLIPKSLLKADSIKPANKLTFGDFEGLFYADCLYGCGNAYDPSIYRINSTYYSSPRQGIDTSFDIMVRSDNADNSNRWAEAMMKKEGEDWVMDNKFNCNPEKYSDLAGQLLKDEPIQEITIGYDLLESLRLQVIDCELPTATIKE